MSESALKQEFDTRLQCLDGNHDFAGSRGVAPQDMLAIISRCAKVRGTPEDTCYQHLVSYNPDWDFEILATDADDTGSLFTKVVISRDSSSDRNPLTGAKRMRPGDGDSRYEPLENAILKIFGTDGPIGIFCDATSSPDWTQILTDPYDEEMQKASPIYLLANAATFWDEATKMTSKQCTFHVMKPPNAGPFVTSLNGNVRFMLLYDEAGQTRIAVADARGEIATWQMSDLFPSQQKEHIFSVNKLSLLAYTRNSEVVLKPGASDIEREKVNKVYIENLLDDGEFYDRILTTKFSEDSLQALNVGWLQRHKDDISKFKLDDNLSVTEQIFNAFVGITFDRVAFYYAIANQVPYIYQRVTKDQETYIIYNPHPGATQSTPLSQELIEQRVKRVAKLQGTFESYKMNDWEHKDYIELLLNERLINLNVEFPSTERILIKLENLAQELSEKITDQSSFYQAINNAFGTDLKDSNDDSNFMDEMITLDEFVNYMRTSTYELDLDLKDYMVLNFPSFRLGDLKTYAVNLANRQRVTVRPTKPIVSDRSKDNFQKLQEQIKEAIETLRTGSIASMPAKDLQRMTKRLIPIIPEFNTGVRELRKMLSNKYLKDTYLNIAGQGAQSPKPLISNVPELMAHYRQLFMEKKQATMPPEELGFVSQIFPYEAYTMFLDEVKQAYRRRYTLPNKAQETDSASGSVSGSDDPDAGSDRSGPQSPQLGGLPILAGVTLGGVPRTPVRTGMTPTGMTPVRTGTPVTSHQALFKQYESPLRYAAEKHKVAADINYSDDFNVDSILERELKSRHKEQMTLEQNTTIDMLMHYIMTNFNELNNLIELMSQYTGTNELIEILVQELINEVKLIPSFIRRLNKFLGTKNDTALIRFLTTTLSESNICWLKETYIRIWLNDVYTQVLKGGGSTRAFTMRDYYQHYFPPYLVYYPLGSISTAA